MGNILIANLKYMLLMVMVVKFLLNLWFILLALRKIFFYRPIHCYDEWNILASFCRVNVIRFVILQFSKRKYGEGYWRILLILPHYVFFAANAMEEFDCFYPPTDFSLRGVLEKDIEAMTFSLKANFYYEISLPFWELLFLIHIFLYVYFSKKILAKGND